MFIAEDTRTNTLVFDTKYEIKFVSYVIALGLED